MSTAAKKPAAAGAAGAAGAGSAAAGGAAAGGAAAATTARAAGAAAGAAPSAAGAVAPINTEDDGAGPSIDEHKEVPALQLAMRTQGGAELLAGPVSVEEPQVKTSYAVEGAADQIAYCRSGAYLGVLGDGTVSIVDTATGEKVGAVKQPEVKVFAWSPLATYILTWHRKTESDSAANLKVWNWRTGEVVAQFHQKSYTPESWPTLQWADDEQISCRCVTNEVHFYGSDMTAGIINKLIVENVVSASLAPGPAPHHVGVFVGATGKGTPAQVRLYKYPEFDPAQVIASKSLFRADTVTFTWAPSGQAVILQFTTEFSADSYMGDSMLHFLSVDGRINQQVPDTAGPVHDVQWAPVKPEFIAITGKSPPSAKLYNGNCEAVFDFGNNARNTIIWNPHGRYVVLAGFGNMNGTMDFWDRYKLKRFGRNTSECTVACSFSPDGRWLLTATLSPRMRVDNGFKLFKYNGAGPYVHQPVGQLFQAMWKPSPSGVYPDRPPSPRARQESKQLLDDEKKDTGPAVVKAYRAPGSSGLVSAMMNADRQSSGPKKIVAAKASGSTTPRQPAAPPARVPVGAAPAKSSGAKKSGPVGAAPVGAPPGSARR